MHHGQSQQRNSSDFPEKHDLSSADSIEDDDDPAEYTIERLNNISPKDIPPHKLYLKIGAIIAGV